MRDEALKRIVPVVGVCVLASALLACAGFPEPEGERDSLVIGSLILDFPEGLYDAVPHKVDMNVRVTIRNVTRNERFHVYTKRGYFYFLTNGTDEFNLESFRILNTQVDDTLHSFSDQPVDLKISNFPSRVVYLGHINAVYSAPQLVRAIGGRGGIQFYSYGVSVTAEWDQERLQRDFARRRPDSFWLNLRITEYGRNSQDRWQQQEFTERRSHPNYLLQM